MSKNKLSFNLFKQPLLLMLMAVFISLASIANATSVDSLLADNKLKVVLSVDKTEQVVPKQQLLLHVDFKSVLPFSGDVALPYIEISNAIVIEDTNRPVLTTEEIDGQQWFIQRKSISVYPLTGGDFSVPKMQVDVALIDESDTISGKVSSQAYAFTITEPNALQGQKDYISSPKVTLKVKKSAADKPAEVGTAFTYVYEIKADKMHGLMLPDLVINKMQGVQLYQKPILKKDDFDRFEKFNTAVQTQEVTFIFEKEGEFVIPEQRISWWDTKKGEMQQAVIPAETIKVGAGAGVIESLLTNPFKNISIEKANVVIWLVVFLVLALFVALFWQLNRHKQAIQNSFDRVNKTQQKQLSRDYFEHVEQGNYAQAMACLYELAGVENGAVLSTLLDKANNGCLEQLKQLAFNESVKQIAFSVDDAKSLFEAVLKQSSPLTKVDKNSPFKFSIKLNEGSEQ